MKPLKMSPGKHVLFYTIYTPNGEHLVSISKEEDARKVLAHLNQEAYRPLKSNVLKMKGNL